MFEIPKINQIVKINVFDDGRREFEQYINQWKITKVMFGGGKIELINVHDETIKINSLSSWKATLSKPE